MMKKKQTSNAMLISIVLPTFNEEENIDNILNDIFLETKKIKKYDFEIIVIDNNSNDNTRNILKNNLIKYKNLKLIFNLKNFGQLRSPFYAMTQASGEAIIVMSSDYQDPVDLIPKYIKEWESGNPIVLGRKKNSKENKFFGMFRRLYYRVLKIISSLNISIDTTGAGIYDKKIINSLSKINDPYPYLRGLIFEIVDKVSYIDFIQPKRNFGKSKNNIFSLIDIGILGIVKLSIMPLRTMTIIGFLLSFISISIAIVFFIYKLLNWYTFEAGIAPLIIGIFAILSFIVMFLGILGEYILIILNYNKKIPLVIEESRHNFN